MRSCTFVKEDCTIGTVVSNNNYVDCTHIPSRTGLELIAPEGDCCSVFQGATAVRLSLGNVQQHLGRSH